MNIDHDREERLRDTVSDVVVLLNKSRLTMRNSTMVGVTVAISGLAENVTADQVVERFPAFVHMLNMALETYQRGALTVEATVIKTTAH